MEKIKNMLEAAGYYASLPILLAVRWLLEVKKTGVSALLVTGPAGAGKTFLARALARGLGLDTPTFVQVHAWTTPEELFRGVNIAAAVAGDADAVYTDGALAEAAAKSQHGLTVLVIDELDKARQAVEDCLLDFLQTGLVPLGGGEFVQANLDNLLVFITSNETREHGDPLIRRCRRLRMPVLSNELAVRVISEGAQVSPDFARTVWRASREMGAESPQEGVNLAEELRFASSAEEVALILSAWARPGKEGDAKVFAAGLWSAVKAGRL